MCEAKELVTNSVFASQRTVLYDFRRISWGNDFVRCFRILKLPKIRELSNRGDTAVYVNISRKG